MSCWTKAFGAQFVSFLRCAPVVLGALFTLATHAADTTLSEIRAMAADQHYSAALDRLEAYLKDHGDDVEARLFKGVILTRQGDVDGAIEVFDQLSKDRPELPEPLNNLAVLYAAQGRYEDARKVLIRAIRLEPGYETAHENLGDVYAKLANIAYERAYTLDQRNTAARDKANWMTRLLDTEPGVPDDVLSDSTTPVSDQATPEDQRVVPRAQSDAEMAAVKKQMTSVCYAVNGIESHAAAQSVVDWFKARKIIATDQMRSVQENIFYEVYVPPLETRAEADEKLQRMRNDGFVDIMRINSGELENGISVGAYRKLGNAQRRVKTFRAKGYEVEFKPRDRTRTTYWVSVNAGTTRDQRSEFTDAFPAYPLSESTCR